MHVELYFYPAFASHLFSTAIRSFRIFCQYCLSRTRLIIPRTSPRGSPPYLSLRIAALTDCPPPGSLSRYEGQVPSALSPTDHIATVSTEENEMEPPLGEFLIAPRNGHMMPPSAASVAMPSRTRHRRGLSLDQGLMQRHRYTPSPLNPFAQKFDNVPQLQRPSTPVRQTGM